MSSIKKVVIPVAGLGTRFLPVTKAQPKEMLPILDKPIIQYIVEEVVRAGITDIILVTGPGKRALEDHFDRNENLERFCLENGKEEYCEKIKEVAEMANFIYIRQKGPYGNGTPVMNARGVIGNEPFAVVWGDEIWQGKVPHLKQLIDVYEKYGDPVITAQETDDEGTSKYGIIEGTEVEPSIHQVSSIVEKPGPENTTSRLATFGGHIFTPDVFDILDSTPLGKGNELWLVDGIAGLMKKRPVYAKVVDGTVHDTGSKLTWLKANIEYALHDETISSEFKEYLKQKVS